MPVKPVWTIQLLDELCARRATGEVVRFSSRKAALLLSCLALSPGRTFSRETLMERLWPEEDPEATRDRFKQTLAVLRRILEPEGVEAGSVLVADRSQVRLNAETVTSDVADFTRTLRQANRTEDPVHAIPLLENARAAYRGELLPGFSEDWAEAERRRLAELQRTVLARLATLLAQTGRLTEATERAQELVHLDPLHEPANCLLMEIYQRVGRFSDVERQYRELETILKETLGTVPSVEARHRKERARTAARALLITPRPEFPIPADRGKEAVSEPPVSAPELPLPLTRFFGRADEIQHLCDALLPGNGPASRLITLTGPGGCGKTRLALEIAKRLREALKGGVWVVPTGGLQTAEQVAAAIADALLLPPVAATDGLTRIVTALSPYPTVLVLDNFDMAADEGASVLTKLLSHVPSLHCLVTSRQSLYIEGEEIHGVGPLPVPTGETTLEEVPSVQLFLDRAQSVRRGFRLTAENAEAVRSLCIRLEGIPLALELAAAQAAVLTPLQIGQRLKSRLDFLVSSRRDVDPRHRSLRAAIEDSYRLLSPEQQTVFTRLAAFRGTFSLAAVEAVVCDTELPATMDCLGVLAGLVGRSLLIAEEGGGEMRYRLLESLADFAGECLSGKERTNLYERHTAYFLSVAEAADADLPEEEALLRAHGLETDLDNLRAVLTRALGEGADAHKEETTALRLTTALRRFWDLRGYHQEGATWFQKLRATFAPRRTLLWARAMEAEGDLLNVWGQHRVARPLLEESLSIFREYQDRGGMAQAVCGLGEVLCSLGEYSVAEPLFQEGLTLLETLGDALPEHGRAQGGLARIALERQDFEEANRLYEQSAELYRRARARRGVAWAIHMRGIVAIRQKDSPAARVYFDQALELFRDLGDELSALHSLTNLAEIAEGSDPETAWANYSQALPLCQRTGSLDWERHCRCRLGRMTFHSGEDSAAEEQFSLALTASLAHGGTVSTLEPIYYLSHIAARQGRAEQAVLLSAAAEALARQCGVPYPPANDTAYKAALSRAHAMLGEDRTTHITTRARIEGWHETVRRALHLP